MHRICSIYDPQPKKSLMKIIECINDNLQDNPKNRKLLKQKELGYHEIGAVILLLLGWLLIGCNRRAATYHRENGWYHVVNTNADDLARVPIVTAKDFEALSLDTDTFGKLIIFGQIHPYFADRWEVETEKPSDDKSLSCSTTRW